MCMSRFTFFIFLIFPFSDVFTQTTFEIESEVFRLINQHRESIGVKPLISSDIINFEARKHSANVASGNTSYGHHGFKQRAGRVRRVVKCGAMGENITRVFSLEIARSALNSWLSSKGHRENLENPTYTLSGVGAARTKSGMFYITQIFAEKQYN